MTSPRSVYSHQINALLFLQYKFQQYYNRRVISCSSSYQWKPQLPSFIFTYLTVSYPQWSWHIQSVGKQLALRTLRKLPTLGREPSFCTLQNFRIGLRKRKLNASLASCEKSSSRGEIIARRRRDMRWCDVTLSPVAFPPPLSLPFAPQRWLRVPASQHYPPLLHYILFIISLVVRHPLQCQLLFSSSPCIFISVAPILFNPLAPLPSPAVQPHPRPRFTLTPVCLSLISLTLLPITSPSLLSLSIFRVRP